MYFVSNECIAFILKDTERDIWTPEAELLKSHIVLNQLTYSRFKFAESV